MRGAFCATTGDLEAIKWRHTHTRQLADCAVLRADPYVTGLRNDISEHWHVRARRMEILIYNQLQTSGDTVQGRTRKYTCAPMRPAITRKAAAQ